MEDGNLIAAPVIGMQTDTAPQWRRRDFVKGLGALAGPRGRLATTGSQPSAGRRRRLLGSGSSRTHEDAGAALCTLAQAVSWVA